MMLNHISIKASKVRIPHILVYYEKSQFHELNSTTPILKFHYLTDCLIDSLQRKPFGNNVYKTLNKSFSISSIFRQVYS